MTPSSFSRASLKEELVFQGFTQILELIPEF